MIYGPMLAAAMIVAAQSPNAGDIARAAVPAHETAPSAAAVAPLPPAGPAVGAVAPEFTYQAHDCLWSSLHGLLEQGDVLLVFGAGDEQLRSLERDQEALLGRGIVPVAVVAQRAGDAWRTVRRCSLTYSLLSDPHLAIAGLYGTADPAGRSARAAWFVIGRDGVVRGSGGGVAAPRDWTALASSALGLSETRTASAR